ncbi:MAG: acetyl-CoA carboxylase biotin carboxylase subunit [Elusimicrobia bacterium]|nr:acetyl-CoA carboxylase biotin carboxylase subunit [Candidatus Obscuribacterium magneticum]
MFKKVLIANRGEIAVRVIRACRELDIRSVAVHSDVDRDSLHVKLADESVCIGPAPTSDSYLNIPAIISAAEITGADAIHPGYGFLSENAHFAEVCESCGIKFIGPTSSTIKNMGDKVLARQLMEKYGVPILPGSDGPVAADDPGLFKLAKKIGYPIMVKARAGGGGKGMRIVYEEPQLREAIVAAQTEAKASFKEGGVFLEKYLESPRHIEVQVAGDVHGDVVSFPERDCTIQRRHQKLVEESPSPMVNERLRKKMGKAARRAARAAKYVTVGTVEFLYDGDSDFYFLEMNTRIQVEHPVTEFVTGIDLIKEQVRLAAGEKLGYDKDDVKVLGHAIECRINAEDPDQNFAPSPGKITGLVLPGGPGVRVDTHIYAGYTVPTHYDSLLGKLIVGSARGRLAAVSRMDRALREFLIEGIKTTVPFHQKVMANAAFRKGQFSTDFIEKYLGPNGGNNANK